MELRTVDPKTLKSNPANPRHASAGDFADEQLAANIKTVGILQPPVVREESGDLVIVAGNRRVNAAIAAGLDQILVLVRGPGDGADQLRSLSENVVRAQMGPVDQWRAIEALASDHWTIEAIGTALALPVRTIKKLRLLAHIHPAILDQIAGGDMPREDELRIIAAAGREEQASVWKKLKPKKGETNTSWYQIANALKKRRLYAKNARFGEQESEAFGIFWEEDLFEQGDEDTRYTTQTEAFFAAQAAWLDANLPKNGAVLPIDDYGHAKLPPKAERVWAKPKKGDTAGQYVDPRDGHIEEIVFRMPSKTQKTGKHIQAGTEDETLKVPAKTRPEITQKGLSLIGAQRTDALAKALIENPINDTTLLGILILAFTAHNVDIKSGNFTRDKLRLAAQRITDGGHLTQDTKLLRKEARQMLSLILSCEPGYNDSGLAARFIGDACGADAHLPNMATEEFLSCVSKPGLERIAANAGILPRARAKDTRAALIEAKAMQTFVLPQAHFALDEAELAIHQAAIQCPADYDDGEEDGSDRDREPNDLTIETEIEQMLGETGQQPAEEEEAGEYIEPEVPFHPQAEHPHDTDSDFENGPGQIY